MTYEQAVEKIHSDPSRHRVDTVATLFDREPADVALDCARLRGSRFLKALNSERSHTAAPKSWYDQVVARIRGYLNGPGDINNTVFTGDGVAKVTHSYTERDFADVLAVALGKSSADVLEDIKD
jgi:hypothetical protein